VPNNYKGSTVIDHNFYMLQKIPCNPDIIFMTLPALARNLQKSYQDCLRNRLSELVLQTG